VTSILAYFCKFPAVLAGPVRAVFSRTIVSHFCSRGDCGSFAF